jgi:hypothetical protein
MNDCRYFTRTRGAQATLIDFGAIDGKTGHMRASLLVLLTWFALSATAQEVLPTGSAPRALEFDHFPSRFHAFVWRNWNLVETARLARVVGTAAENVRSVAASMGLPPERPVPGAFRSRLYLSIIRRNWHLLPYEQLMELLGVTPGQLAQTLREDDFLWIKLGSLKPRCEPLVYAPPDERAMARCEQIAKLVRTSFAADERAVEEPLAFLTSLGRSIPDDQFRPARGDWSHPRFLYSYFAVFGDPLADPSLDPYPDGLLQRYADLGINGVWLHVVLRDLAPSKEFAEFGQGHEQRLANLARLVERAKRFNIGIYLYINEPRAMPAAFFKPAGRQELAGVREGDHVALCTSNPAVRKWLEDSLAYVFERVPGLAGVFTITASENLTNCASHGRQGDCPQCKGRKSADILTEVNQTIERGVHRASPDANIIAWDWGWPDAAAPDVIAALPESMFLMSVSEWSLPIERGGIRSSVGEYSISAVGPGPRATRHWALAKARGLRTLAKVAANNTWELSAVPYLPVYDLIARHAAGLAKRDVDGLMLSWSLGGYPSANLEVFKRVSGKEEPERVLEEIARRKFGEGGAAHARAAWRLFGAAFEQFPYGGGVVYNAPLQVGPANLMFLAPTGYHASMVGFPYDDLNAWRGPYPAGVFVGQMRKLAAGWADGVAELERAVVAALPEKAEAARRELNIARVALLHFASVANQAEFVQTRDSLRASQDPADRERLKAKLIELVRAESVNARELFLLQRRDSRIGFEASNHYYYLPQDLMEKVVNCDHLLRQLATDN